MEHMAAPVHKGLMLPRLLFGLPFTFAVIVGFLSYWAVIVVHLYLFGLFLFVTLYVLGRIMAKRDVFFIDFVLAIPRFKGVID